MGINQVIIGIKSIPFIKFYWISPATLSFWSNDGQREVSALDKQFNLTFAMQSRTAKHGVFQVF